MAKLHTLPLANESVLRQNSHNTKHAPACALQVRVAGEKDADDIRTLMQEVDMRIGETKKATYEFKRDIIIAGEDAHTGVICADRVVRCERTVQACRSSQLRMNYRKPGFAMRFVSCLLVRRRASIGAFCSSPLCKAQRIHTSLSRGPLLHAPDSLRTAWPARRCSWRRLA